MTATARPPAPSAASSCCSWRWSSMACSTGRKTVVSSPTSKRPQGRQPSAEPAVDFGREGQRRRAALERLIGPEFGGELRLVLRDALVVRADQIVAFEAALAG